MAKLRRFFKFLSAIIALLLLLALSAGTFWWHMKTDGERSDFFFAIHHYQKAIEYDPSNSYAWMERSVAFNKAGDFQKGFEYLNRAVELDPIAHLGYRGWIKLRKLRDYEGALRDFDRLDSLTKDFVDAPWGEDIDFLRGECHFGNRNYLKAVECFRKSISNQKEGWADVQTFVYLGLCERELGNYANAIDEFQRAVNQYENTCEAHFNLAKVYLSIDSLGKAKEHIMKAEGSFAYRRNDVYNEFLNEIYWDDISNLRQQINDSVQPKP